VQAPNHFFGQCLSAKVEDPMIWHNQLPEWQEKSLSRLQNLDTADGVPNSKIRRKKGDSCASAIRRTHLRRFASRQKARRPHRPRHPPVRTATQKGDETGHFRLSPAGGCRYDAVKNDRPPGHFCSTCAIAFARSVGDTSSCSLSSNATAGEGAHSPTGQAECGVRLKRWLRRLGMRRGIPHVGHTDAVGS
jgi:hypothetical protein